MRQSLVILLTYGEPDNTDFWGHYQYSLSILRRLTLRIAKIPKPLLPLIALRRAWGRVREWKSHGVVSPLEEMTRAQARALAGELGEHFQVKEAYEFRSPRLEDVIREIRLDPPERVILVPMYTVDSDLTTGISKSDLLWESLRNGDLPCPLFQVSRFNEDPEFIDLMVEQVHESLRLRGWKEEWGPESGLLLGCHGTVLKAPPGVNSGLEAFEGLYRSMAGRLSPHFKEISVGWMNHSRGGPWTQPDMESALRLLAGKGIKRLVYYPFGFLADANETTHESRHAFEPFPGLEVQHLPCLNAWEPFIAYLARRVRSAS